MVEHNLSLKVAYTYAGGQQGRDAGTGVVGAQDGMAGAGIARAEGRAEGRVRPRTRGNDRERRAQR